MAATIRIPVRRLELFSATAPKVRIVSTPLYEYELATNSLVITVLQMASEALQPLPTTPRSVTSTPTVPKPKGAKCALCSKTFTRIYDCNRHFQSVHRRFRFQCALGCDNNQGLGWSREDHRNEHIRRRHPAFKWNTKRTESAEL
jgi:hypothetical protein